MTTMMEPVCGVLVRHEPGEAVTVSYEHLAAPVLGRSDLLVTPSFVGVCGSDLELLAGHLDDTFPVQYPHILGHEWSGVVAAVGAQVHGFEIGQLIVGHGSLGDNRWFGVTTDGAMAERFVVPAAMCFAVPDGVSAQRAAMVEPLACVLQALQHAGGADASHTAVVFGCGTLGLAMIGLLASTGARVVAVDPSEQRRAIAARLGAELMLPAISGGEITAALQERFDLPGADLVVECSGAPPAQAAALEVTRLRARLLYMGLAHGDAAGAALRLIQTNDLTVTSSTGAPARVWEPALRLMQRTGLDLTSAVSDVYLFQDCQRALAAAANPRTSGKVMLSPAETA